MLVMRVHRSDGEFGQGRKERIQSCQAAIEN